MKTRKTMTMNTLNTVTRHGGGNTDDLTMTKRKQID